MSAYEWSYEYNAFIKKCACNDCATGVFVGTESQEESVEIFRKNFSPHIGMSDGLQCRCLACERARKGGHNGHDREQRLKAQGGICAICNKEIAFDGTPTGAHMDHKYGTGLARGVLCSECNPKLGPLEKDLQWFHKAQEYLQKWEEILKEQEDE